MVFAVPGDNVRHSSDGTPNPAPGRRFLLHHAAGTGEPSLSIERIDALGVKP
ncbi:hypothetical protein FAIPA1_70044 [Frankia sp. AiPs1]